MKYSRSVLLGSGGFSTTSRRNLFREAVSDHFTACSEILFVPYASHWEDWGTYTERMQDFLGDPRLLNIDSFDDHSEAVEGAEAIYVGGGNSFLLIKELHDRGLIGPIRDRVEAGVPYLGVSAGSNIACPTMMTTNDMPIVAPQSFESLGIVPFQINPHYHPGKIIFMDGEELSQHYGESRSQRIAEFHRHSSTPVLGMWEGSFLHWDGYEGELTGRASLFRRDRENPEDIKDSRLGYSFWK